KKQVKFCKTCSSPAEHGFNHHTIKQGPRRGGSIRGKRMMSLCALPLLRKRKLCTKQERPRQTTPGENGPSFMKTSVRIPVKIVRSTFYIQTKKTQTKTLTPYT
ncbi:unnamed protein product, partial [Pylaiella littoralis]